MLNSTELNCCSLIKWVTVLGFENLTRMSHDMCPHDDALPQPQRVVLLRLSPQKKLLGGGAGFEHEPELFPQNELEDLSEPC